MLDPVKIRAELTYINNARIANTLSQAEFEKKMRAECEYLATNAVTLFTKCCNGAIDEAKIAVMLSMMARIKDGGITEFDANVSIGQQLTDEYVAPLVKNK